MANSLALDELIAAIGLPEELALKKLNQLASANGLNINNLSVDQLRELVADLLQDVLLEVKAELSQF